MQSKWLRHCAMAAVLSSVPMITFAQTATPAPEPNTPAATTPDNRAENLRHDRRALGSFDRLLDQHPEFAKDLRQNPNLINDQSFVSKHPELQKYLQNHPAVAKHLQQNPKGVLKRERNYDRAKDRAQKNRR